MCEVCVCIYIHTEIYVTSLTFKVWSVDQEEWPPLEICCKCKVSDPTPKCSILIFTRLICVHIRVSETLPWKCYDDHVNNKMRESHKDEDPTFLIIKRTVHVQICLWFLV